MFLFGFFHFLAGKTSIVSNISTAFFLIATLLQHLQIILFEQ